MPSPVDLARRNPRESNHCFTPVGPATALVSGPAQWFKPADGTPLHVRAHRHDAGTCAGQSLLGIEVVHGAVGRNADFGAADILAVHAVVPGDKMAGRELDAGAEGGITGGRLDARTRHESIGPAVLPHAGAIGWRRCCALHADRGVAGSGINLK